MKYKHGWVGAVCCFVLFVVVCLFLTMHMKGAFRAAGHPEIGLLFFTLPGAVASFCSHRREVIKPLLGAMLAAPCCFAAHAFFLYAHSLAVAGDGVVIQRGVLVCFGSLMLPVHQQFVQAATA